MPSRKAKSSTRAPTPFETTVAARKKTEATVLESKASTTVPHRSTFGGQAIPLVARATSNASASSSRASTSKTSNRRARDTDEDEDEAPPRKKSKGKEWEREDVYKNVFHYNDDDEKNSTLR